MPELLDELLDVDELLVPPDELLELDEPVELDELPVPSWQLAVRSELTTQVRPVGHPQLVQSPG